MIDIVRIDTDMGFYDTQTTRAKNILSTQLGSLVYAPDLGINLKFFLSEEFSFQTDSFKSYLIQVLANNSINVQTIDEVITNLYQVFGFNLTPEQTDTALITR